MKSFIFCLAFLLIISNCFCQTINGKVLDIDTKNPLAGTEVFLTNINATNDTLNICNWQIFKYKIILQTITDSFGNFYFDSLHFGKYNIVVVYKMPKIEKLGGVCAVRDEIDSNICINNKSSYTDTFHLMVTCPYDKTKNQKFCPVCKQSDEVVPIIFGLPVYNENGSISGYSDGKYYLGGCSVDPYCNPTKHCNRCKINF